MRKPATVLLVATALPALAASPAPTVDVEKAIYVFAAPRAKCYFIRQTNRQLQPPGEKPVFMPLAGAAQLPTTPEFTNCMPEQRIIKVGGR